MECILYPKRLNTNPNAADGVYSLPKKTEYKSKCRRWNVFSTQKDWIQIQMPQMECILYPKRLNTNPNAADGMYSLPKKTEYKSKCRRWSVFSTQKDWIQIQMPQMECILNPKRLNTNPNAADGMYSLPKKTEYKSKCRRWSVFSTQKDRIQIQMPQMECILYPKRLNTNPNAADGMYSLPKKTEYKSKCRRGVYSLSGKTEYKSKCRWWSVFSTQKDWTQIQMPQMECILYPKRLNTNTNAADEVYSLPKKTEYKSKCRRWNVFSTQKDWIQIQMPQMECILYPERLNTNLNAADGMYSLSGKTEYKSKCKWWSVFSTQKDWIQIKMPQMECIQYPKRLNTNPNVADGMYSLPKKTEYKSKCRRWSVFSTQKDWIQIQMPQIECILCPKRLNTNPNAADGMYSLP